MIRHVLLATTLGLGLGAHVVAQTRQSFEVASVKPSAPDRVEPESTIPRMVPANGRLTITNMPLRLLIRIALDVQDFQISGGPANLMLSKFDISAKAESATALTTKNTLAMLRTLLEDRFKLKTHTESREMPVYALVIARDDGKLGPEMKASTADCAADEKACALLPMGRGPGTFGLRATGQPLDGLIQLITQATGRTVVDKTGLKGLFDFQLQFDPEVMQQVAARQGVNAPPLNSTTSSSPPSESPALMTAIRDQLGLRLDSQRGLVEVLVVDHVEAPTPD